MIATIYRCKQANKQTNKQTNKQNSSYRRYGNHFTFQLHHAVDNMNKTIYFGGLGRAPGTKNNTLFNNLEEKV